MEDVLFVLPAELHTFMLVHIGYRRSIRHHFGTIAFKNRIQYANDWSQKISVHIPMRKAAIRVKAKRTRWNTWFQRVGGDGEIRTLASVWADLPHFESFPPCDFWWKLSEDGSTQRKPKSCGILRILASVFRFYLNPQGFPSSSHFCPELWPEDRTRIELDARLGVFTPIPFHENANHHFD